MSERIEFEVMGRVIGTSSGWDQVDTWAMHLYDFVPAEGIILPKGGVTFDFERGLATSYTDSGTIIEAIDIVHALSEMDNTNL